MTFPLQASLRSRASVCFLVPVCGGLRLWQQPEGSEISALLACHGHNRLLILYVARAPGATEECETT